MIAENYQIVTAKINDAIEKQREVYVNAGLVTLVAVTKNHDVAAVREYIDAAAATGQTVISVGENRVQEAKQKFDEIGRSVVVDGKEVKIVWHLIGHLQTNKVKTAVEIFDLIHSIDSERLLRAVNEEAKKHGKIQDILLQVNLAEEESKFGIDAASVEQLVRLADDLLNVNLLGLMLIAPNYEDAEMARPLFKEMYQLYRRMKRLPLSTSDLRCLSMGMTNDYVVAVEEGATVVRIGTAIFGPRQYEDENN